MSANLQISKKFPLPSVLCFITVTLWFLSSDPALAQTPLPDSFNPGANGYVYSLAVQADAKILVGGYFTTLGEQARNCIGRLNADGSLDTSFNPGAGGTYPHVYSLAVQADGKILVGGEFTTLGGQARNNIGWLNADGSLDTSFNPGADGSVYSLVVQADGKILVGGGFTMLGGQPRNYIGRLNPDGTLDTGFNPGTEGWVASLAVQADGKILVGGEFNTLGGYSCYNIGRLNADGTLDGGFNPGVDGAVYSMAVQADGKILVGGSLWMLGGQPRNYIGRLNPDGTLDPGFMNIGADGGMNSLAVQADGKILVGGWFTSLGGLPRNHLARLNADGTLDTWFNPGANNPVSSLAMQADGKILVGGWFTTLAGQPCNYIGRLNNTEPAVQSLDYNGSTITWLRGGTSPEVWRTTFEHSSDGLIWASLGVGSRITDGWELTDISTPSGGTIRARGYVSGGYYNGSGWFVEGYAGDPVFITQPSSQTNDTSTTATFSVLAGGSGPFFYQWLKNGVALVDGGNLAGATTAALTLYRARPIGGFATPAQRQAC